MSSDLVQQKQEEQDFEMPQDVDEVVGWMESFDIVLPDQGGKDLGDVPPPPPPVSDEQKAKEEVERLKAGVIQLEQKVGSLTKLALQATRTFDKFPNDRKAFDQLLESQKQTIGPVESAVKTLQAELQQGIGAAMKLPGMDAHRESLKKVYDQFQDIEFDFQIDQFTAAREAAVERIKTAISISKPIVDTGNRLIGEMKTLVQEAQDGKRDFSSWNPHGRRNSYHALTAQAATIMTNAPKDGSLTTEAYDVLHDLSVELQVMRNKLIQLTVDKADIPKRSQELVDLCSSVLGEVDNDDFDIDSWSPLANGPKWEALTDKADALQGAVKDISDKKLQEKATLALGVYEEVRDTLYVKASDKEAMEKFLNGRVDELQRLQDELARLAELAEGFSSKVESVVKGENCDSNAERKALWFQFNFQWLPDDGSPWTQATQDFVAIKGKIEVIDKDLPWDLGKVADTVKDVYKRTGLVYEEACQMVLKAHELHQQHAPTVLAYKTDLDQGEIQALAQEAADRAEESQRIGNSAAGFTKVNGPAIQKLPQDKIATALKYVSDDWFQKPGTAWTENLEALNELGRRIEDQKKILAWEPQCIRDLVQAYEDARSVMNAQAEFVDATNKLYSELEAMGQKATPGGDEDVGGGEEHHQLDVQAPDYVPVEDEFIVSDEEDEEEIGDTLGKDKDVQTKQGGIMDERDAVKREKVTKWLIDIGFGKYNSNFVDNGYEALDFIKAITNEDELREINIAKGDIATLLESIKGLKSHVPDENEFIVSDDEEEIGDTLGKLDNVEPPGVHPVPPPKKPVGPPTKGFEGIKDDEFIVDNEDVYDAPDEEDGVDTAGMDEEEEEEFLPKVGGDDFSDFVKQIRDEAGKYVADRQLDVKEHQDLIDEGVQELLQDLKDQGNNDRKQMNDKLAGILGDVPKVMNSRLPLAQEAAQDKDAPDQLKIPDETMVLIDEAMDKRAGDRDDKEDLKQKLLKQMQEYYGSDFSKWNQMHDADLQFLLQQNPPKDPPEKLPDTGFELTGSFWKKNKGTFADTRGDLTKSLQLYENRREAAKAGKGVDKLHQLAALPHLLDDVLDVAQNVANGLGATVHKKTLTLLRGISFAVEKERSAIEKEYELAVKALPKLTYQTVNSTAESANLWQEFLKDPGQKAHAEQQEFATRYEEPDPERSEKLRKFAQAKLNLAGASYKFELDDEASWKGIYDKVIWQLQQAFPLPFNEWIGEFCRETARKNASKKK